MLDQCGHPLCCCGSDWGWARDRRVWSGVGKQSWSIRCPHGPQRADRSAGRVHGFTAWRLIRKSAAPFEQKKGGIPRRAHGRCSFATRQGLPASNTLSSGRRAMQGLSGARCPKHPRGGCSLASSENRPVVHPFLPGRGRASCLGFRRPGRSGVNPSRQVREFGIDDDDLGVGDEAVDERDEARGVGEGLAPLGEGPVVVIMWSAACCCGWRRY